MNSFVTLIISALVGSGIAIALAAVVAYGVTTAVPDPVDKPLIGAPAQP